MKYLTIFLSLYFICFSSINARIIEGESNETNKRFLGSLTNWLNNNNNGEMSNYFTNTKLDQFNNVVSQIKDPLLNVAKTSGGIFFPQQINQHDINLYNLTCRSRYDINGVESDFFFDRPNGCISKGFSGPLAEIYNQCCDEHNKCLDNKICTSNCQNLKQECDTAYEACTKEACWEITDNIKLLECIRYSVAVSNIVKSVKCNANSSRNRKLCYCNA